MKRYLINIYGIVQGVGFRPFVYQKANEYNILGWVLNSGANVVIDAEGEKESLKLFILDIINKKPPIARIEKIAISNQKVIGYSNFQIRDSKIDTDEIIKVSPDICVCEKCMAEVNDRDSARFRYPFTNCTECGPRFSIIKSLPYDRCATTMKDFDMCGDCDEEYNNPNSRRFHTEPNCCSRCGPQYTLIDLDGKNIKCDDVFIKTADFIKKGSIVAIKGLGGFHLCCNAENETAIKTLRCRKNRQDKPLAVMMKDIQTVQQYCEISEKEQELILSAKRPIVLLKKKIDCNLPENIAPSLKRLGVMLPYLPLHHLLFEEGLNILVMTSGNISGNPIEYKNEAAFHNLKNVADYFFIHNRIIYNPIDDSVVKVVLNREMVSRRARGYIPYSQNVGFGNNIIALGAQQKSTFSILQNGYLYLSQYLGELTDLDTYNLYKKAIANLTYLHKSNPKVYAYDLHTAYLSSEYAQKQQGLKIKVQHHHAHMVSCMAEHDLYENVIGVIFDGTGLGADQSIWGGEFLVGNRKNFTRAGHLKTVVLQGGDTAVKMPWKTALCYLHSLGIKGQDILKDINEFSIDATIQAIESNLNCHKSSSMGRLFDCISALIGLVQHITYDAQAAIELENMIDESIDSVYEYDVLKEKDVFILDYSKIILGVLKDIKNKLLPPTISAMFHNTISKATVQVVCKIRECYMLNTVVLSGGVFENSHLLKSVYTELASNNFKVYFNEQIPINDSGISVGQLITAAESIKE